MSVTVYLSVNKNFILATLLFRYFVHLISHYLDIFLFCYLPFSLYIFYTFFNSYKQTFQIYIYPEMYALVLIYRCKIFTTIGCNCNYFYMKFVLLNIKFQVKMCIRIPVYVLLVSIFVLLFFRLSFLCF